MPLSCLFKRIREAIKNRRIIRLKKDLYVIPNVVDQEKLNWLILSKEEKVFKLISESKVSHTYKIKEQAELSNSEFWRAIKNLIETDRIRRIKYGTYVPNHACQ